MSIREGEQKKLQQAIFKSWFGNAPLRAHYLVNNFFN